MKRIRFSIAILLVFAFILGACQGDKQPAETQAPVTEETTLVQCGISQFTATLRAR